MSYLTAVNNVLYFGAYDGKNGNELWKSDVITSYSIHYTKLYDSMLRETRQTARLQIRIDGMVRLEELVCRITSYNVCYTKLLRNV